MAISKEEIKKLADLARIEIQDAEAEELSGQIDAILEYVGQVKSIAELGNEGVLSPEQGEGGHEVPDGVGDMNVLREDEVLHEGGEFSADIIAEFPDKDGDYLKVKKIL